MSSSNRHWPSMFKSKPCNTHHNQWQHDNLNPSLISTATCPRATISSVPGCEERSPEPKPRWNPKPEQIRILEALFNSGMVNPPREEIRKIRAQLQEYGQVGDANVFYWFQNRKSRSKIKKRNLQTPANSQTNHHSPPTTKAATATTTAPPSSSSSSSDKSSQKSVDKAFSINVMDGLSSPTASVNQPYFNSMGEFLPEPYFFPVHQTTTGGTTAAAPYTQGFFFPELSPNVVQNINPHDPTVGNCSSLLFTDLMMNLGHVNNNNKVEDHEKVKLQGQQQLGYTTTAPISPHSIHLPTSASLPVPSAINQIQGEGPAKSTVFINDEAFEVGMGPFNVRQAFGEDAVLIHSSGQTVVTNEWGVTLQSLQHGAFYYLVRTLTPSSHDHLNTIDLI